MDGSAIQGSRGMVARYEKVASWLCKIIQHTTKAVVVM